MFYSVFCFSDVALINFRYNVPCASAAGLYQFRANKYKMLRTSSRERRPNSGILISLNQLIVFDVFTTIIKTIANLI